MEPIRLPDGAARLGTLTWVPGVDAPELLGEPVAAGLHDLIARVPTAADDVLVAPIDPDHADTAAMSERYDLALELSANCVIVAGRRAGEERVAACVVRATTRADVNNRVKRLLDVRKASFWPMELAVAASGMEYGAITPLGLPAGEGRWRLLLDTRVLDGWAIIGSGVRGSKLLLPGALLAEVPGSEVVDRLGI
jgi:prolyl-tRNA editing enzyme YbaK/EbsC (Cys-tRNA(Pro) deacylase)